MFTFSIEGRDFERKKSSVRTGKIIRLFLLFIIGKFFKGIYLFTQFGNLFRKKLSRNVYRRKFIQYYNRGFNVCEIFFWGGWGTVL